MEKGEEHYVEPVDVGENAADSLHRRKSLSKAVLWLKRASDKDYPEGQYLIALKYVHGVGVTKNLEEAARLLRLAADWGDGRAQYNLGVSYATGRGVPRDTVQAHVWFSLAASQGNKNGESAVPRIERMMSPEQVAEARRLREDWAPRERIRSTEISDWEWLARSPSPELP